MMKWQQFHLPNATGGHADPQLLVWWSSTTSVRAPGGPTLIGQVNGLHVLRALRTSKDGLEAHTKKISIKFL